MSNEVMNFNFDGAEVRVKTNENNEPWFVAKDVCSYFGDSDHKRSIGRLDEDETQQADVVDSMGRNQKATIVNESGLYHLLFNFQPAKARSKDGGAQIAPHIAERLEKVNAFKRWVTHEVLPSIRKSGGYIAAKADETPEMIMARAIKLADETINRQKLQLEEKDKKIAEVNRQIEMDKPKVVFAESIAVAKTSILVGEMAKLIKQSTGIDIGQNRFFDYLRGNGFLHSTGSQKNLPTQKSVDRGLFEIKEGTRLNSNGVSVITRTPKITGRGQLYFINLFKKESNSLPLM